MRIYSNCYELMSEMTRDVLEMGIITHSKSMQHIRVDNDPNYDTKEIIQYSYCLTSIDKSEYLFNDKESKIWVSRELMERLYSLDNPGNAWKLRESLWKKLMNSNGKFDYTYGERINEVDAVTQIIELLKENPDSRQAILSIWDRNIDIYRVNGKARVPCSVYYQFLLRGDRLNIIYNQRSADVYTHIGNDIWLAFMLMKHVAECVGVGTGFLYHNIGSLHSYRKDWPALETLVDTLRKRK
jgi:thymidylate synthase